MEHSSLFIINNMNCGLMKNELSTASDEARLWGKGVCAKLHADKKRRSHPCLLNVFFDNIFFF